MTLRFTCQGQPLGKPRMTRRDKWAKRACVTKYWRWCDDLRGSAQLKQKLQLDTPHKLSICAYFQIPRSWTARQLVHLGGTYHTVAPDWDNVAKAVMDALIENDAVVSFGRTCKLWDDGNGPRVEVILEEL